jgi:hypothetical protein
VIADDPIIRCVDSAGEVYGPRFSEVREGTRPRRYCVRDAGTVHRLAYPRELRKKLGLGKPSLAEFEADHPVPPAGGPTYPGTNVVRSRPWYPVRPPRPVESARERNR